MGHWVKFKVRIPQGLPLGELRGLGEEVSALSSRLNWSCSSFSVMAARNNQHWGFAFQKGVLHEHTIHTVPHMLTLYQCLFPTLFAILQSLLFFKAHCHSCHRHLPIKQHHQSHGTEIKEQEWIQTGQTDLNAFVLNFLFKGLFTTWSLHVFSLIGYLSDLLKRFHLHLAT